MCFEEVTCIGAAKLIIKWKLVLLHLWIHLGSNETKDY